MKQIQIAIKLLNKKLTNIDEVLSIKN